jgi:hypothetical protein
MARVVVEMNEAITGKSRVAGRESRVGV